jgi:ABC-type transport system involved in multi-copper enzyme maturation permease subunit
MARLRVPSISELNPVFVRELRSRMRGIRGYLVLGVSAAIQIATLCTYWVAEPPGSSAYLSVADFSRTFFIVATCIQATIVALIAPAFTAGVISLERERQTLEMLLMTRLTRRSIILGKLSASMFQLLLVVVGGIPVSVGTCLMLGGLAPVEATMTYLFLVLIGVSCGAAGLYASCLFRRTMASTAVAYLFVATLLIGTGVLDAIDQVVTRSYSAPLGWVNFCPPYAAYTIVADNAHMDTRLTVGLKAAFGVDVQAWELAGFAYGLLLVGCVLGAIAQLRRMDRSGA